MKEMRVTEFLFSFVRNGKKYGFTFPAESFEEAEDVIKAIGETGTVDGILVATVPFSETTFYVENRSSQLEDRRYEDCYRLQSIHSYS